MIWRFTRKYLIITIFAVPAMAACEMKVAGETVDGYFSQVQEAELARAASRGNVGDVRRLVEAGVNINSAGKQNMTPLVWALTARNTEGMRALLELGADPNQEVGPEKQFHPVWLAAGLDDPRQLAMLLEFRGDPNAYHKGADYVPLMHAKTKLKNVQLLVEAGADINAADLLGIPFVLDAASLAQYDIVLYALQNGFNRNLPLLAWELNDRRPDGRAPLPAELEPMRLSVLEMLRNMDVTPLPGKAPPLIPR